MKNNLLVDNMKKLTTIAWICCSSNVTLNTDKSKVVTCLLLNEGLVRPLYIMYDFRAQLEGTRTRSEI